MNAKLFLFYFIGIALFDGSYLKGAEQGFAIWQSFLKDLSNEAVNEKTLEDTLDNIAKQKNFPIDEQLNDSSALHLAAKRNFGSIIKKLLDAGANPTLKDKYGDTALLTAIKEKNKKAALAFIKHEKAKDALEIKDSRSNSPLAYALRKADNDTKDIALELLKKNVKVPQIYKDLTHNSSSILSYLLMKGAEYEDLIDEYIKQDLKQIASDPYIIPSHPIEILQYPMATHNLELLIFYIKHIKKYADVILEEDENNHKLGLAKNMIDTGLINAIGFDNSDAATLLISEGADVNQKEVGFWERSALHFAAQQNNIDIIQKLITAGANVDQADNNGKTPLSFAINNQNPEASLLLLNNSNADIANTWKSFFSYNLPINLLGYRDIKKDALLCNLFKAFISKGADLNLKDNSGRTPLHYAAIIGDKELVDTIISKNNSLINAKDTENGDTPLHFASYFGNKDAIEELITKGATIDIKNNSKRTPLMYTNLYNDSMSEERLKSKHLITNLLKKKGANENITDSEGKKIADYEKEFKEFIKKELYSKTQLEKKLLELTEKLAQLKTQLTNLATKLQKLQKSLIKIKTN